VLAGIDGPASAAIAQALILTVQRAKMAIAGCRKPFHVASLNAQEYARLFRCWQLSAAPSFAPQFQAWNRGAHAWSVATPGRLTGTICAVAGIKVETCVSGIFFDEATKCLKMGFCADPRCCIRKVPTITRKRCSSHSPDAMPTVRAYRGSAKAYAEPKEKFALHSGVGS